MEKKEFNSIHAYLRFLKDQKTDEDIQMALYIERKIMPMWDLLEYYRGDYGSKTYGSVFTKILKCNVISNAMILFETVDYQYCFIFHDAIKETSWQQCLSFITTHVDKKIKFTALVATGDNAISKTTYLPITKMIDEDGVGISTGIIPGGLCSIM